MGIKSFRIIPRQQRIGSAALRTPRPAGAEIVHSGGLRPPCALRAPSLPPSGLRPHRAAPCGRGGNAHKRPPAAALQSPARLARASRRRGTQPANGLGISLILKTQARTASPSLACWHKPAQVRSSHGTSPAGHSKRGRGACRRHETRRGKQSTRCPGDIGRGCSHEGDKRT